MRKYSKNNNLIKFTILLIFMVLCFATSLNSAIIAYADDNASSSVSKQNSQAAPFTSADRTENEHYINGNKLSDLHTSIDEFEEITFAIADDIEFRKDWNLVKKEK